MLDYNNFNDFIKNNSLISLTTYFYNVKNGKNFNKKYQCFYNELLNKMNFLKINNITEMLYYYRNNIKEKPKCIQCRK